MAKGDSKITQQQASAPAAPAVDNDKPRNMTREEVKALLPEIEDGILTTRTKDGKPIKITKQAKEYFKTLYYFTRNKVQQDYDFGNENEHDKYRMSWGNVYVTEDQKWLTEQSGRGMQALINSEKYRIEMDVQYGIISPNEGIKRARALRMVQNTLNDHAKEERRIKLWR